MVRKEFSLFSFDGNTRNGNSTRFSAYGRRARGQVLVAIMLGSENRFTEDSRSVHIRNGLLQYSDRVKAKSKERGWGWNARKDRENFGMSAVSVGDPKYVPRGNAKSKYGIKAV